jgi:ParB-like chromosome segregation protein Spo0J
MALASRLEARVKWMDPSKVVPYHSEIYPKKTKMIAESMLKDGWRGRPILVKKLSTGRLRAVSGSHRVRAAIQACLKSIPVIQLTDMEVLAMEEIQDWFTAESGILWPLIEGNLFS